MESEALIAAPAPALEDDSLRQVMLHLAASDIVACRAVSRSWLKICSEDHLWKRLVSEAFWPGRLEMVPEQPLAPLGGALEGSAGSSSLFIPSSVVEPTSSWRVAFERWTALSRYVDGGKGTSAALWMRIAEAWALIERALREKAPQIEQTLCRPTTSERLAQIRCRSLRYIFAIHDGQHLAIDRFMLAHDKEGVHNNMASLWHGLFGGYSAYRHNVCMRMHPASVGASIVTQLGPDVFRLPDAALQGAPGGPEGGAAAASQAEMEDAAMEECGGAYDPTKPDNRLELLSTSYGFNRCFAVDARAAVWCRGQGGAWELAARSVSAWFCEYARRLSTGFYRVGQVYGPLPGEGIVLFPECPDGEWCTRCVTQGIEVVASALYTPEHPQTFAYSLRMRMAADAPRTSAQLFRRLWTIEDGNDEPPRRVSGEGVVGMFPVLRAGGGYRNDEQTASLAVRPFEMAVPPGTEHPGWFVYQSFSGPMRSPEGGRFGGEIEFYPGTVTNPTGPPFNVTVLPFRLAKPEFVY